ncbi:MAG TPA: class I SAM-dependent methyltransferase [Smithella sp.]|nr:class I SAM-dependent methyltransferase [Smithella sp.]HRS97840.1 class I SAM-dependent methyltransferase [Smithella sp.]
MMSQAVINNHRRYLERTALYKTFGYDIEKERSFIIEKAQPVIGNILEAGTGKGYFTLALARAGYHFFSFDISAEEQRYALLNLMYYNLQQQVTFGIADVESMPCNDGFFDVIFAVNMIHHLSSVRRACAELVRILSPHGKIVLSDFNADGLAILDKIHALEGRKHEVNSGTMIDAKNVLTERGLHMEEHHRPTQDVLIARHMAE